MKEKNLSETLDKVLEFKHREVTYPSDHRPAMRVPRGGSSCSSCEYLGEDKCSCRNKHFIRWHGSHRLPWPADQFCSDWYEPCDDCL